MSRVRGSLWFRGAIPLLIGAILSTPFVFDSCRVSSLHHRASVLQVGDTKAQVISALGNYDGWFGNGEQRILRGQRAREQWAYGTWFDWDNAFSREFPYFNPLRFRLFDPDSDDVVIEFDDEGKVYSVTIP